MATRLSKEHKLEPKAKLFIVEAIREVLEDPDFGLELTAQAKKRLREAFDASKRRVSLSEIRRKYY